MLTIDAVQDIQKIDSFPTNGLLGTENSLAYRTEAVEKHFHSRERWFGKKAVQTATDWADDTITPYQAISGAGDYGGDADDEAQVIGTDDTPAISGSVRYDVHRVFITDVSQDSIYKLRVVYGAGTMADMITAGQYSEVLIKFDATNPQQSAGIPFDIHMPRLVCGSDKVWLQAWNAADNATVDFFVGIHEYAG